MSNPAPRSLAIALAATLVAAGCQQKKPAAAPEPEPERSTAERGKGATSTASIEPETEARRVAHAEELLEGRFAGVRVIRRDGGIAVQIRGPTSVYGSNEPLFVVDGIPIQAGPGGALHGINPQDIARIEVLKDVASTAFYGVRGANGVILITTRRPE